MNKRNTAQQNAKELCEQLAKEKGEQQLELEIVCRNLNDQDANVSTQLKIGYEAKSQKLLNALRNQFKDKLCVAGMDVVGDLMAVFCAGRSELERWLEEQSTNNDSNLEGNIEQLTQVQGQLTACTTEQNKLRICVDRLQREHKKNVDKIRRMQQELVALLKQYQDLIDIKFLLDFELAAYNQMLAIEEYRLNVSDMCQQEPPGCQSSATKRSASSECNDAKRKC